MILEFTDTGVKYSVKNSLSSRPRCCTDNEFFTEYCKYQISDLLESEKHEALLPAQ